MMDIFFEVLASDDDGANTGVVKVGERFVPRVDKWSKTHAVAAREHPVQNVRVDVELASDNGNAISCTRSLRHFWRGRESVVPFCRESGGNAHVHAVEEDMGFGIFILFVQHLDRVTFVEATVDLGCQCAMAEEDVRTGNRGQGVPTGGNKM
jgi:hypothetical protein